ncbi:amino acid permease [Williamsoniiplasma luminosum]|uniref:Amino acid permease n=1 Tax=Williamsoniiplasma luminosum TaxID=214888 RepID=A0A2K8NW22_9MOLU|nr:APC family permease [Williamsoniiplasma luminosum]ATZ16941.1 amino acid permease [Williamsoniiplasma luminosum]
MSNNKPKAKTFEFLSLFIMVIGAVIGSGIYMKNNELLQLTHNPIIAIISWLIVGMVCIMIVYVFIEISSATTHIGNGTVPTWAKMFINRKTASWFSIVYTVLYYPICQSLFAGALVAYFFKSINQPLSANNQLIILLVCGIVFILIFNLLNMLKPQIGRQFQIVATVFKFIPLVIALFAGFFLIGPDSSIKNGGFEGNMWSTSDFAPENFIRGFGPVLFAFDGFIYMANLQKRAKFKDVVPKSLLFGLVFVTIFYVLMAISLFMGSPDGSIVQLLTKLFAISGSENANTIANIVSNIILMFICLFGINIFSMVAINGLESDVDAKLIYTNNKHVSFVKAGIVHSIFTIFFFTFIVLMGALVPRGNWMGISTNYENWSSSHQQLGVPEYLRFTTNHILAFINTISTAISTFGFLMIGIVLIASIFNRRSNKVEVVKMKGFIPIAIIASMLLIFFVICGIITFVLPNNNEKWIDSEGFLFTIICFCLFIFVFSLFLIQEHFFKKNGLDGGFEGFISSNQRKEMDYVKE